MCQEDHDGSRPFFLAFFVNLALTLHSPPVCGGAGYMPVAIRSIYCSRDLKESETASEGVGNTLSPERGDQDDLNSKREAKVQQLAELWTRQRAAGVNKLLLLEVRA